MSQLEMIAAPMHDGAWSLGTSRAATHDSRTLMRRYLMGAVLPLATLAAMSALVITTIVIVVTAVARAAIPF
jgi:hypothetical protein